MLMAALQEPMASWNMPAFLEIYTLHDSSLQEVHLNPYSGLIVVVEWDLFWNKDIPKDFSRLAIWFVDPYVVNWRQGSWKFSTLDGATSNLVSDQEKEMMLKESTIDLREYNQDIDGAQPCMFDDALTRTVFDVMNGSSVEILHSQKVCFSCFDDNERSLMVPQR